LSDDTKPVRIVWTRQLRFLLLCAALLAAIAAVYVAFVSQAFPYEGLAVFAWVWLFGMTVWMIVYELRHGQP
jgi:hypothetical protein